VKAIILCGGRGTRLGSLTRDLPKPLIDVAGRPFLEYVLDQLLSEQVDEFVLAAGFRWQKIRDVIGDEWRGVKVTYSIEQEPLGTGGAIKRALMHVGATEALVVNGDTLLKFDAGALAKFAKNRNADIGVVLTMVPDTGRFGKVIVDHDGRVISFDEKWPSSVGLINSGLYYIKSSVLDAIAGKAFSLETDILRTSCSRLAIYGLPTSAYFVDIGIPLDLERAQDELRQVGAIENE
jgi:D-glycero-alpha-D-manno-heptose 1-phosphate guanylyltransferase